MKTFFLAVPALLLAGCIGVNKSITVADGEHLQRDLSTVNGSIRIGRDAVVEGDAETVNGSVELGPGCTAGAVETVNGKVKVGEGAKAASVEAVNGAIEIGPAAEIAGAVETVNGRITVGAGTVVAGAVEAVNGQIVLHGADVGRLANHSGGMVLEAGSRVRGELRVSKSRGFGNNKPVTVIIHADSRVAGPLVFERPVDLRIHETAKVGEIVGAEPTWFSD